MRKFYFLSVLFLGVFFCVSEIFAQDTDGDGITDADETAQGYNPNRYTRFVYVDASRPNDSGDGFTLANAKKTIGAAVTISKTSTYENVILVAAGTYSGTGNKNISFGGYEIKMKSISGYADTIVDLEWEGRFLSITSSTTTTSEVDGFTIKNGYIDYGAGIYLNLSNLIVRNCLFDNNVSPNYRGGALYCGTSGLRVENSSFLYNTSGNYGGAIYTSHGTVTIERCDFVGNMAKINSGAIEPDHSSTVNVLNCNFIENYSDGQGGCFVVKDLSVFNMTNCFASGNYSNDIIDILLVKSGCSSNLMNCTIMGNNIAGVIHIKNVGILNLCNTIFQGTFNGIPTSVNYCCTSVDCSGYGTGNFIAAPLINPTGFLRAGSPCIDAGTTTNAPLIDIIGQNRPAGTGIDIGCYEFIDTDSDGIPDIIETASNLDPNNAADAPMDSDGDGISNLDEFSLWGTNPSLKDTDNDGLDDNVEIALGFSPINSVDGLKDSDKDGMLNNLEILLGRNYMKLYVTDTTDILSFKVFTPLY